MGAKVPIMTEFGDAISREVVQLLTQGRRELALTMEELADRAHVDRTYIGLLERGERRPTVAIAASIASGLGLLLSNVVALAERQFDFTNLPSDSGIAPSDVELVPVPPSRKVPQTNVKSAARLKSETGLDGDAVVAAIESAYHTFDLIDEQLIERKSPPLAGLVEPANLSSILGNLVAAGLAEASQGRYARSGPHKYPDLIANVGGAPNIEVKVALEGNTPKGHLPKEGAYLTFRYVLCDRAGKFVPGRANRGEVAIIWEAKYGILKATDFNVSSTEGDSGKTAVIRAAAFDNMELVYFDADLCPKPSLIRRFKN